MEARELLENERVEAWQAYLEATRGQQEPRYTEIESWAWGRLRACLRAIRAREKAIAR